jgi:uncharacterized protein (DUF2126 family)
LTRRATTAHELEIAFAQVGTDGGSPPWLVDRVFRNVLVDVTGNTHRPSSASTSSTPRKRAGATGLVELRAFEMPPHARMSLAQQLLLRRSSRGSGGSLTRPRWSRWGTELHDRSCCRHFVAEDFRRRDRRPPEVGIPLRAEWFAPHAEFRFPVYGTVGARGVRLELRQALEPWHVMGEERGRAAPCATWIPQWSACRSRRPAHRSRHAVACNGRRVPMHPTGTPANSWRACGIGHGSPPSALHPTIPVHAPLVFDLVDGWNQRAIAGCVYHVAHPGGRHFERFPVNAYEAESRRLARFATGGHTPSAAAVPPEERNPRFSRSRSIFARPAQPHSDAFDDAAPQ